MHVSASPIVSQEGTASVEWTCPLQRVDGKSCITVTGRRVWLQCVQGHRSGLANGHCLYDLDVSRAPEEDIKSHTRIKQELANGPKQPISPRGSGDSDFVKVESPSQHSPESLPERCVSLNPPMQQVSSSLDEASSTCS